MKWDRAIAPAVTAAIALAGSLASTLSLYGSAVTALDRVIEERLWGAGESAAAVIGDQSPDPIRLRAVMRTNGLDGAYVVDARARVLADASGRSGHRADLLRLDLDRLQNALGGNASLAPGYKLDALTVMTGYFPIWNDTGSVRAVLVLEAGQIFVGPHARIARARFLGVSLSLLSSLSLAMVVGKWSRAERQRRAAATRAARGDALSRIAAMAAHEIRNPLGVIQGTVDLMRERSAATLTVRDRQALEDIGGEVERLRRLTQELVDLAAERPLNLQATSIPELLDEVSRATERAYPGITIKRDVQPIPPVAADPTRLRQVFTNLLTNAAQAQGEGAVDVEAKTDRRQLRVVVRDRGPGIPDEISERLFDLYFTTKTGGTGLGLAIARRFVERHGGTIAHLRDGKPGAAFEVSLPIRPAPEERLERG